MEYIGFIYKWTNVENNMFYIGSHKGKINDGYVASGKYFLPEYKKHKDLFKRVILEYIYDISELYEREQFYFDLHDLKNNPLTYNLNIKAAGGWDFAHASYAIIERRNKSLRNGWENGRVVHNKGKSIDAIYSPEVALKIRENAKNTIGGKYSRNKGERGSGLKNSYSKIVLIEYLHGNLKVICEGNYYKWFSSGTYKKTNSKIWKVEYVDKDSYDPILYTDCIKYNGEKYDKNFLLEITENKNVLGVHNRFYYLCEHIESGLKIISDLPKTKLVLCLKGGTGKKVWKFNAISFDEYKIYKNKFKYYDGKNKLCGQTIREYCSIL